MVKEKYKGKKSPRKPRRNARHPRPRNTGAKLRAQTGVTRIDERQHVVPLEHLAGCPDCKAKTTQECICDNLNHSDVGGNEHEAQGVPESVVLAAEMRGNWESQVRRSERAESCLRRTLLAVEKFWVGERAFDVIADIKGVLNAKN